MSQRGVLTQIKKKQKGKEEDRRGGSGAGQRGWEISALCKFVS